MKLACWFDVIGQYFLQSILYDDQLVQFFQIDQVVFQNFGVFVLKTLCLGMAIFARSAGTRSGPTLMGRILPGPIRNRVGYGFPKKNPKRVRVGFGF